MADAPDDDTITLEDWMYDADLFALVGVEAGASKKALSTAYRKTARKIHPDHNPDDPDAARRTLCASDRSCVLTGRAGAAYDAHVRTSMARKRKREALDRQQRNMVDKLAEREAEAQVAKRRKFTHGADVRRGESDADAAVRRELERELTQLRGDARPIIPKPAAGAAGAAVAGAAAAAAAPASSLTEDYTLVVKWRAPVVYTEADLGELCADVGAGAEAVVMVPGKRATRGKALLLMRRRADAIALWRRERARSRAGAARAFASVAWADPPRAPQGVSDAGGDGGDDLAPAPPTAATQTSHAPPVPVVPTGSLFAAGAPESGGGSGARVRAFGSFGGASSFKSFSFGAGAGGVGGAGGVAGEAARQAREAERARVLAAMLAEDAAAEGDA